MKEHMPSLRYHQFLFPTKTVWLSKPFQNCEQLHRSSSLPSLPVKEDFVEQHKQKHPLLGKPELNGREQTVRIAILPTLALSSKRWGLLRKRCPRLSKCSKAPVLQWYHLDVNNKQSRHTPWIFEHAWISTYQQHTFIIMCCNAGMSISKPLQVN